jgi:UDP-glucose:(heptosyl)LPS alpha-1,3-glucosyltransferase
VHSHERTPLHHVTTFHGPPFATVRARPLWRRLSVRIGVQLFLERRELMVAQSVVPVSGAVAAQLAAYYPFVREKLTAPVTPGVAPGPVRGARPAARDGGVIGFVGTEWRRKGLAFAASIVAALRAHRPNAELWVIGPAPDDVRHLFAGWSGGFRLLGWRDGTGHFAQIDVLLHPARAEPFGMAVTEAMAARVPVVVSDVCGAAAEVDGAHGQVLSLQDPVETWVVAVDRQLARPEAPLPYIHGWDTVAEQYERIYRALRTVP